MFQLYKKRDFSQLVGDTFTFFKMEGKNYFKNYFIINGGLLLILVVLIVFFMKFFLEGTFASVQNQENDNFLLNQFYSNMPIFIGSGIIAFLLIMLISLINYTYPIAYLSKVGVGQKEITTQQLIQFLKENALRSIQFYIFSIFIIIPFLLIITAIMILLFMIIIGIPLLLIVLPAILNWIALSYYNYMLTKEGYFQSLAKGFEMLKSNFWANVFSTAIMYIIVQIIASILTFIPYTFGIFNTYTNPQSFENNPESIFSFVIILVTVVAGVSILANYILQNLILVNQGVIYYSITEKEQNINLNSEIDSIGQNEE